jgi:hypothetical protein
MSMRRFSTVCAVLGLAATAFVATSPAQASYKVIRWDTTGACEIWDTSFAIKPFASDYKTVTRSVSTFIDALAAKEHVFHAARCTI